MSGLVFWSPERISPHDAPGESTTSRWAGERPARTGLPWSSTIRTLADPHGFIVT